ncbi:MAG: hypothetical protein RI963_83 [Planctomycetota bacterium]
MRRRGRSWAAAGGEDRGGAGAFVERVPSRSR